MKSIPLIDGSLPPLISVDVTRTVCGQRGRGWVYDRLAAGDFESIQDGTRRLILTDSVLRYIERLRDEASADHLEEMS